VPCIFIRIGRSSIEILSDDQMTYFELRGCLENTSPTVAKTFGGVS
jgi:hypothetical protein